MGIICRMGKSKGMDAEYNNKEDLDTIRNRLTNRVKNQNKNQW